MTDLDQRIRLQLAAWRLNVESLREHGMDLIALDALMQAQAAIGAVLDLHKTNDDDHLCIDEIVGYSVQRWYDDEPCPTVLDIAKALGIEADRD